MAGSSGPSIVVKVMEEIMTAGGSAVDGVIAGMSCTWAATPILGGPAGSGLFVVHSSEEVYVLDAMATQPFKSRERPSPEIVPVNVLNNQMFFQFGPSTASPSCLLKALLYLHNKHGKLPWNELFKPIIRELKNGIEVTPYIHDMNSMFNDVLDRYSGMAYLIGNTDGSLKTPGSYLYNDKLIHFFEELSENPSHTILQSSYEAIGLEYEDIDFSIVEPLTIEVWGHQVLTSPPPTAGGLLLCHCLKHMASSLKPFESEHERYPKLMEALVDTVRVREEMVVGHLYDPDIAQNVLGNTEQYSVVDSDGLCVSATATNGTGSGIICDNYGFLFNNMLGEPDLNPKGFLQEEPGRRLSSNMSPVIVKKDGQVQYLLGSSGSERIRSAIANTLVNLLVDEMELSESVEKRRVHFNGKKFMAEEPVLQEYKDREDFGIFPSNYFIFGGCHTVKVHTRESKGDPRRDGQNFRIN